MKRLIAFLTCAALLLVQACHEEPYLKVTPPSLSFNEEGGSQTVHVSSNYRWTASASGSGFSVSPNFGDGETQVTITAAPSSSPDPVSGTVNFTSEGLSASVSVNQEAKPTLQVGQMTTIPAEGGTVVVDIHYNTDYTVEIESEARSWITFTGTKSLSSGKLTFEVEANDSPDKRTGKVTVKDKSGKVPPVTLVFEQEEKKVLQVGETMPIPAEGGTFEVDVKYNTDFTVEVEKSAQSWITFVKTKALKSGKLEYSYFQTGLKNLMDLAIINRSEKEDLGYLKEAYTREDEIPFDFSRRRMSVVLRDKNGKRQLITKGAVEEMLSLCSFIEIGGEVKPITPELIAGAQKIADENNAEGIRVIAVAQKNEVHDVKTFGVQDESDMVLIGFVGFLDPPKPSAGSAITALQKNGVRTVVLTGDNEGVAVAICGRLGIDTGYTLTGAKVEAMNDEELKEACEKCHIFSKLSPYQKQRVVKAFQSNGHIVGYMGDGINDSLPLKQADVGISVDTAVDIAKEVADIILLEKDLQVLEEGVIEGRRTFANMSKYLKMTVSGNFGNMFSVLIASIFLPFLPMLPIHILVQNLLNDFAQLGMPFDHVEDRYIEKPKRWDIPGIKRFMICFGLLSTVLDVLCFLVLWFVFGFNNIEKAGYFQCGWFMFGVISQTMVIHTIRTPKIPFIQDRASKQLTLSTLAVCIATLLIGFTAIAGLFSMPVMPISFLAWITCLMVIYTVLAQVLKIVYIRINKEWV